MSCMDAKKELVALLKSGIIPKDDNGRLKKEARPESVKRVVMPIEMVLREVLTTQLAHMS